MLTGFQVSTGAWVTEDYDILHEGCIDDNYVRPMSNYELDEHDASQSEDLGYDEEEGQEHVEYCSCTMGIQCAGCWGDIREPWYDPDCIELREVKEREREAAE